MKRFLIAAATVALMAAPALAAQDQHDHGQGRSAGGQGGHSTAGSGQGGHSAVITGQGGHSAVITGQGGHSAVITGQGGHPTIGSGQGKPTFDTGHNWRPPVGANQGRRPPFDAGAGRNQDRHSFQRNFDSRRHYRGPAFRWPHGFSYRRYAYGQFLPLVFLSSSYWLYDYAEYGLPYPPPGTYWLRYGPDALLVDRHTGEIIQVIYGVFY